MSTNKSANLNLHLWEPEDNFLRTEFNENFEKLDERGGAWSAQLAQLMTAPPPYVVGTYKGTGEVIYVDLGFRPSFLIISGQGSGTALQNSIQYVGISYGSNLSSFVSFTDTGFRVVAKADLTMTSNEFPKLNLANRNYGYIAFR